MMKKALLYVATAIMLGSVTMIAPLILLKPAYYELITSRGGEDGRDSQAFLDSLGEGEGPYEKTGVLERAVSPSNLLSAGLIFILGFLISLGGYRHAKKRMF
jgi:hypothetical protein